MKHAHDRLSRAGVRGLTLVEILISVAVLGILLAVAVPSLVDLLERRRVVNTAGELAGLFNYAKAEANARGGEIIMHMEPEEDGKTSCVRISNAGTTDECTCNLPADKVCKGGNTTLLREFILPVSSGVSFEASATKWNMDKYTVTFSRNVRYTDIEGVRLAVTGRRTGAMLWVEYSNVGRVRICSPASKVGGFSKCE